MNKKIYISVACAFALNGYAIDLGTISITEKVNNINFNLKEVHPLLNTLHHFYHILDNIHYDLLL